MTEQPAFDRDGVRIKVLDGALAHVPFDGWTLSALQRGATDAGFQPEMALRVFPRGAAEAIEFWCALSDRRMVAELERRDAGALKTRERVALAVRLRLEANLRHREAVRRALGFLALPVHADVAATTLWRTVDAIWYAAGDRATDFNFYTKRALLAGVYGATLLYWLDDRSEDCAQTWRFLDRRIADALRVPQAFAGLGERLGRLPNPLRMFGFDLAARR